MKFALKVLPKPEVLDVQGRAVEGTLKQHGFKIESCSVGRYIVLDVKAATIDEGREAAKAMAEKGLYNPLIEKYILEPMQ